MRIYYQQFEEQQTQSLIDQRIKQHLDQTGGYPQVGAVFNQHMLARPRPPMMLPPGGMPMGMRPPVLPRPMMPGQGNFCYLNSYPLAVQIYITKVLVDNFHIVIFRKD